MAVLLSVFAFLLIAGAGPWAGPIVLDLGGNHGVHAGDLPVLAGWVVGVAAAWRLGRR